MLTDEQTPDWDETAFLQISESRVGRAIRTPEYTYAVRAPGDGYRVFASDVYYEEFFYVLKEDPYQQNNLAADLRGPKHAHSWHRCFVKRWSKRAKRRRRYGFRVW